MQKEINCKSLRFVSIGIQCFSPQDIDATLALNSSEKIF